MPRRAVLICLAGLCAVVAGCTRRSYDGDQRFPLSGTVTVDDEPMDEGTISFLPQFDKGRVSGGEIHDGKYDVIEARGANAGSYRVEISWQKKTGKKIIDPINITEGWYWERKEALPEKYRSKSELSVQVSQSKNQFDFDLRTGE